MARAAQAIIDLHAIRENYQEAKRKAASSKAFAVVKANAYGHGLLQVAQALVETADGFAVACVEEAQVLRQGQIESPILVLEGVMEPNEYASVCELSLEVGIHNQLQLDWLRQSAQKPKCVHIKVDTGMHRLGFALEQVASVASELRQLGIEKIELMSHFACADEPENPLNAQQLIRVQTLAPMNLPLSLCNSAGIFSFSQAHYQMVRPGIMLFGGSPLLDKSAHELNLLPAMTLQSNVIAIHDIKAGESVGYGQGFVAQQETRIAVVAIGYGDGYPRGAQNGTPVLIKGKSYPLAGRVSMDMITVDISSSEQENVPVELGDMATLWGTGLSADEVAKHCDTISYELFCQVTNRVHKRYLGAK